MFEKDAKVWKTMVFGYSDDIVCVKVDFRLWKETDRYTDVRIKFSDGTCIRVRYMNDNPEGTRWCIKETKKGSAPGKLVTYRYPLGDVYVTDAIPISMKGVYHEDS